MASSTPNPTNYNSATALTTQATFLTISPEIRTLIYRQLFTNTHLQHSNTTTPNTQVSQLPAILLTSRHTHNEALPIFHSTTAFSLCNLNFAYPTSLRLPNTSLIQNLTLTNIGNLSSLSFFPSLHSLTINLTPSGTATRLLPSCTAAPETARLHRVLEHLPIAMSSPTPTSARPVHAFIGAMCEGRDKWWILSVLEWYGMYACTAGVNADVAAEAECGNQAPPTAFPFGCAGAFTAATATASRLHSHSRSRFCSRSRLRLRLRLSLDLSPLLTSREIANKHDVSRMGIQWVLGMYDAAVETWVFCVVVRGCDGVHRYEVRVDEALEESIGWEWEDVEEDSEG